jgi:hypothetical protein
VGLHVRFFHELVGTGLQFGRLFGVEPAERGDRMRFWANDKGAAHEEKRQGKKERKELHSAGEGGY